jgi:hypothetical protein
VSRGVFWVIWASERAFLGLPVEQRGRSAGAAGPLTVPGLPELQVSGAVAGRVVVAGAGAADGGLPREPPRPLLGRQPCVLGIHLGGAINHRAHREKTHRNRSVGRGEAGMGEKALGGKALGEKALGGKALGGKALGGRALGEKALGGKALGGKALSGKAGRDIS